MSLLTLMLSCSLLISVCQASKEIPKSCVEQNLPVTVGGKRDDVAQCLVYDPQT